MITLPHCLSSFKASLFISVLFSFFLSSCTLLSPPRSQQAISSASSWKEHQQQLEQLTHWQAKGAISIRTARTGQSAQFDWQQHGQEYIFTLIAPLGAGSATISGTPKQALLQLSNGERYIASNSTDLLYQYTGWYLPTEYFNYWIRGLPAPQVPAYKKLDSQYRLSHLQQSNWHIGYLTYQRIGTLFLPRMLTLNHGDLQLRLVIKQWNLY